jgi:hypothetical protein
MKQTSLKSHMEPTTHPRIKSIDAPRRSQDVRGRMASVNNYELKTKATDWSLAQLAVCPA